MQPQTKLDALRRILQDVIDSEADDPKLEGIVGDDESYEEWGRGVGALHLLGRLGPFGGQVLEVCVKFSGTYRPHPAMDPLPGIPAEYLCNGGPDGTYEHLRDESPTPAFWKRIERVIETINEARGPRLRFYLRQLSKTSTGFRGVQTAAHSSLSMRRGEQAAPPGDVIRLGRRS